MGFSRRAQRLRGGRCEKIFFHANTQGNQRFIRKGKGETQSMAHYTHEVSIIRMNPLSKKLNFLEIYLKF